MKYDVRFTAYTPDGSKQEQRYTTKISDMKTAITAAIADRWTVETDGEMITFRKTSGNGTHRVATYTPAV